MKIIRISFLILNTFVFLLFPLNILFGAVKEEVIINEVMWGGSDNEWIELKNLTSTEIILNNWSIDNAKSAKKPLLNINGTIPPDGYFLICDTEKIGDINCNFPNASLSLTDSGGNGDLVLKNQEGIPIDTVEGEKWPAGKSSSPKYYSMERVNPRILGIEECNWKTADEKYSYQIESKTYFGTPGAKNSQYSDIDCTEFSANAGDSIISLVGKEIIFDGSLSIGNIDEYFWNFGDGYTATGKIVTHRYEFPGQYLVSLQISNSREKDETIIGVTIFSDSIFISEFSLKEGWIEIVNESENIQDISGWGLASDKEGENFIFPIGSYIAPRSFLFLASSILDNVPFNTNSLFLIYPSGDIRQEIKYENDKGYSIVARRGEDYFYTDTSTPGLPNIINLESETEFSETSSSSASSSSENKSPSVLGEENNQQKTEGSNQTSLKSEIKESKIAESSEKIFGKDLLSLVRDNQKTLVLSTLGTSVFSGFLGLGLVKLRRKIKQDKTTNQGPILQKEKIEVEIEK